MFDAMAWFLSSWMAPTSTGFALALGNVSTCAFQGFWLQAVIAGPLYNTVMACYFFLVSCHGCSMSRLIKLEYFLHAAVLFFALGTSIGFLMEDQYNHSTLHGVSTSFHGFGCVTIVSRPFSFTCCSIVIFLQSEPFVGSMEVHRNVATVPLRAIPICPVNEATMLGYTECLCFTYHSGFVSCC